MELGGFDPEILQDFLTESGELLEQLEGDLVTLEQTPRDPELLNRVFRALHTIKGSASFLTLTNLVSVAHAAESALNAARNGVVVVDRAVMNRLLEAVDLLKTHMGQLRAGEANLTAPDPALVEALTAIGNGQAPAGAEASPVAAAMAASVGASDSGGASPVAAAPANERPAPGGRRPLSLPDNKATLVEFLVADLEDMISKIEQQVSALSDQASRSAGVEQLGELASSLDKSAEFFEIDSMGRLSKLLAKAAGDVESADAGGVEKLVACMRGITGLLTDQTKNLRQGFVVDASTDELGAMLEGAEGAARSEPGDAPGPIEDRVGDAPGEAAPPITAAASVEHGSVKPSEPKAADPIGSSGRAAEPAKGESDASKGAPKGEQTLRVEVGRLETLMNLVGELVLQKNRITALTRRVRDASGLDGELREALSTTSSFLDRVTGDIQVAVMRTRMQPLDKIFGKYPRLIRDLSVKTGKKLELVIEGGETEVDKSVIEELGDPLVHLLRNSADHGIEMPEQRVSAGKPEVGTIKLIASHEGSHVRVQVVDDGRGLDRDRLLKKAVERGLTTAEQGAALSNREVYQFIFAAGFSTAAAVTDLSGRGVGMDVVRTNIEKIKGTINIESEPGRGMRVIIDIPLTIAIMPAMMVGVGPEIYAVPLGSILEIVRPDKEEISTIREHPVLRLRDTVLPLIDAGELFDVPEDTRLPAPFAVVLALGEQRVGLTVSKLIGQQEIVVKRLDEMFHRGGPVSGATVRDDGGVSLIVDVNELFEIAGERRG